MSDIDSSILDEFVLESKSLISDCMSILEDCEGDFTQVQRLREYGNKVDRVMGAARSLAMMAGPNHALHLIGDYSAVCKAVGYQASQIVDNEQFYDICVALLLDATEGLQEMVSNITQSSDDLKRKIPPAFLDRLQWVSGKFSAEVQKSVSSRPSEKLAQDEIDALMKKLGL
ncbi:MAG: hypothetical protein N2578_07310 [Bdellovibrionaceae bacterium]|nr:hypothetical protein [Pseudobdellovibrionaceae bacterium]